MKPNEPPIQVADWPDELIALLERQEHVVSRLHELARYQGSLIEKGRTEPLLGLLAQRQTMIDEFTAMQATLATKTEDLEQRLQSVPAPKKDRIQDLIEGIGQHLQDVMDHDRADQQSLEAARDRVREELATQGAATQARNAYTNAGSPASRYADRQG